MILAIVRLNFLGDGEALVTAYPMAERQLLQKYIPDSII